MGMPRRGDPGNTTEDVTPRIEADLAYVLRARLEDTSLSVDDLRPFGDGHSGFTYTAQVTGRTMDQRCVVRLSPPGARIVGANDVGRQGRVIAAARAEGIPAPRIIAAGSEPVIDERAFVVMDLVAGLSWQDAGLDHTAIAGQAVALATQLSAVPPSRSGIEHEPTYSPVAELERWGALLPRTPDVLRQPADRLLATLHRTAPAKAGPVLVHGDFHYGNLLFDGGRIVALLDWEIASLGEPLLDLACLAVASMRAKYHPEPNPTGSVGATTETLAEMAGVDRGRLRWYVAATCLKYAAILGYNLVLHRRGKRVDPIYESLTETMCGLVDDGAAELAAA